MRSKSYSRKSVALHKSTKSIEDNFLMISGYKIFVEDTYKGKALFRLEFLDKDYNKSFVDYSFPKGWGLNTMLRNALANAGFGTLLTEYNEVYILRDEF